MPSKRKQKKNPFPWRFACIQVAGWEGQIHILNFIYCAQHVPWLPYLALSAKKYMRSLFFLMTEFPSFRSAQRCDTSPETEASDRQFLASVPATREAFRDRALSHGRKRAITGVQV